MCKANGHVTSAQVKVKILKINANITGFTAGKDFIFSLHRFAAFQFDPNPYGAEE